MYPQTQIFRILTFHIYFKIRGTIILTLNNLQKYAYSFKNETQNMEILRQMRDGHEDYNMIYKKTQPSFNYTSSLDKLDPHTHKRKGRADILENRKTQQHNTSLLSSTNALHYLLTTYHILRNRPYNFVLINNQIIRAPLRNATKTQVIILLYYACLYFCCPPKN